MTPVISHLGVTTEARIDVLVGPELSVADYRLAHLREQNNISVGLLTDYLLTEEKNAWDFAVRKHKLFRQLVPFKRAEKYKDRHWFTIFERAFNQSVIERLVEAVFADTDSGVVAFDWIHKGMNDYIGLAERMKRACLGRNIRMIALPHGDSPHCSSMLRLDELDYETADIYGTVKMFDAVVVPNELCGRRYQGHASQLEVLGSPRFNRRWLETLKTMVPLFSMNHEGRLNVVLFLRNVGYPIYWEEVCRTIRMIQRLPGIQLVVKHHTRDWKFERLARRYPELGERRESNLLVTCDPEIHSFSLVRWADAVLDVGTSMAFQAVMQKTPIFSMEYLHPSKATVTEYFPDAAPLCRDELYDGLRRVAANGGASYYDQGEWDRFASEMIEVNGPEVLDGYVNFLEECVR